MSRERTIIDDSNLAAINGGSLAVADTLNEKPIAGPPVLPPDHPPGDGGGTIAPEEENPGGGIGDMEQSEG